MASLQGLPPLPRSLHGLVQAGSAHWKEQERILQIRASIQQDIIETQSRQWGGISNGNGDSTGNSPTNSRRTTIASLQATIARLRREMVSLRQLDMSLLCQLLSLNESIQEYKHLVGDRMSETNSECSNYSLENGLDTIPSIEEESGPEFTDSEAGENGRASEERRRSGISRRSSMQESFKSDRSRTPPKQRPKVPPPAAPQVPDSPIPPPRARTPPTAKRSPLNLVSRTTSVPAGPPIGNIPVDSAMKTASLPVGSVPSHAPLTPPPNAPMSSRAPAPSTPPLPQVPPPIHRTPPTTSSSKRLPRVQSTPVPQAPPRRNRSNASPNSQSSPSLSQRSTYSTYSN